jgi:hypothetical protein
MINLFGEQEPKFNISAAIQEGLEELGNKSTDEGRCRLEEITIHTKGYAEPGYDDVDVVACGNWNDIDKWTDGKSETIDKAPSMAADLIESLCEEHGLTFNLEWSDKWRHCDDCFKLFRTTADSYGWSQYFWFNEEDGEDICGDCVAENPEDYLTSLEGNHESCITIELDLEENGYVKVEDGFENGYHTGQDASPELIANALREQDIHRFIFNLDGTGQFDIKFSVYIHESEKDKLNKQNFDETQKDGPSVSGGLQKALQSISLTDDGVGDGVRVIKCNSDGTATAKTVSKQDFVEGKALAG